MTAHLVIQLPGVPSMLSGQAFDGVSIPDRGSLPVLLGGVVDSVLLQSDDSNEDSYDYGMVMASSRSQGIDFWGSRPAQSSPCRSSWLTVFQAATPFTSG